MVRKYVEISFAEGGRRYTYHVDDDVMIGDEVEVNSPNGALLTRTVLNVMDAEPAFNTKPAWKV